MILDLFIVRLYELIGVRPALLFDEKGVLHSRLDALMRQLLTVNVMHLNRRSQSVQLLFNGEPLATYVIIVRDWWAHVYDFVL